MVRLLEVSLYTFYPDRLVRRRAPVYKGAQNREMLAPIVVSSILLLSVATSVYAQAQAPPLFPKHRRGIYTNRDNIEVIDATPQSPPLETDDPSVPDKGEYEINLFTDADLSKNARSINLLLVDANYGVVPRLIGHELPTQVKFEFPITARKEPGHAFALGIGAAIFGLKFNFYNDEQRGVRVSMYPQFEFATAGGIRKDLAYPGQTATVPLLVSKEVKYLTLVANGAVATPIHDPEREVTGEFGLGFGRAFTRKDAVMTEVRYESTLDFQRDRLVFLNIGLIHGVRNVPVYISLGHSLFSDDGMTHSYIVVGIKAAIQPGKTHVRPSKNGA
jgi:hypothetical protein